VSDLDEELESSDREAVYSALIKLGKEDRREYRHKVESFLSSETDFLREAALKVLVFYWRLPDCRDLAIRMVKKGVEPELRQAAAMGLSGYAKGPSEVLDVLLEIALDADDDEYVRDAAYFSALIVAGVTRHELPMKPRLPEFEPRADWRLLARLVEQCGARVPERLKALADGQSTGR
jgi:hypothetical protein